MRVWAIKALAVTVAVIIAAYLVSIVVLEFFSYIAGFGLIWPWT
jgi:hypothetical protein